MMTRQLATLVTAGIPLVEAVGALTEQVEKLELKRILTQVRDRLNEGSLAREGARAAPRVFPTALRQHGRGRRGLGHARDRARAARRLHGRAVASLRGKVGAALAYPALMMVIGAGLITIMMVVVVPKVTEHLREPRPRAPLVHAAAHRHVERARLEPDARASRRRSSR